MSKVASFFASGLYGLLVVYAPDKTTDPFRDDVEDGHSNQGFALGPGAVTFFLLESCGADVEVRLLDHDAAVVPVDPRSQRVLQVPFLVGESGQVAQVGVEGAEATFPIPPGSYALVFENSLLGNPALASRMAERPRQRCVLTFRPELLPEAKIIRTDARLKPSTPLVLR